MTLGQIAKRLTALEKQIGSLQNQLDYQQAVEGIRRGLDSVDRGEGEPVRKAFAKIRRKHSARR